MMKNKFLTLLLLILTFSSFSQKIDKIIIKEEKLIRPDTFGKSFVTVYNKCISIFLAYNFSNFYTKLWKINFV